MGYKDLEQGRGMKVPTSQKASPCKSKLPALGEKGLDYRGFFIQLGTRKKNTIRIMKSIPFGDGELERSRPVYSSE